MSEIKPALTPEEWALQFAIGEDQEAQRFPLMANDYTTELAIRGRATDWHERNHAMAAMALYGEPFGFTHEDVALLRGVGWIQVDALADRIAALLPPETPK